jgi:Skp family chaperone for outer membrane proteins
MNNIKSYKNKLSKLKTTLIIFFTCVGLLFISSANATVYVVNIQQVYPSMDEYKKAMSELKTMQSNMHNELLDLQKSLDSKLEESETIYHRTGSEEGKEIQNVAKEIRALQQKLQSKQEAFQIELTKRNHELMQKIDHKIRTALDSMYNEIKGDYSRNMRIIDSSTPGLIYYSKNIDLTEKLLEHVNKK